MARVRPPCQATVAVWVASVPALLLVLVLCTPAHSAAVGMGAGAAGTTTSAPLPPWFFSMHGGDVGYNMTVAKHAFGLMLDLGGKGVRTDMFWADIQPTAPTAGQPPVWNEERIQFYVDYYSTAKGMGLEPLVILSGAPDWATRLYQSNATRQAFWDAYKVYATKVVSITNTLKPPAKYFQLWNEVNAVAELDFWFAGCGLFGIAGEVVHTMVPGSTTMINVMADIPLWNEALTNWLTCAGGAIDVIGVDHYPGTWSLDAWYDWDPLEVVLKRCNTQGDLAYGKKPAVLETGYSTWLPSLFNDAAQVRWLNTSLPALRAMVEDARILEHPVWLLNYYQLQDGYQAPDGTHVKGHGPRPGAASGIPEEAHFGVTLDAPGFVKKPGYAELKKQIAAFAAAGSDPHSE